MSHSDSFPPGFQDDRLGHAPYNCVCRQCGGDFLGSKGAALCLLCRNGVNPKLPITKPRKAPLTEGEPSPPCSDNKSPLAASGEAKMGTSEDLRDLLYWMEFQIKASRTGISFEWVPKCEGEPSGFRFMRKYFISDPFPTLLGAINEAKRHERDLR